MSKKVQEDAQPEALATFAATARNGGVKPAGQGVSATTETSGKPGDLDAEEKDAADILGGNATGDKSASMLRLLTTPRPISARDSSRPKNISCATLAALIGVARHVAQPA